MGGKLFNLGRLPRIEYLELEADVRRYLDDRFPDRYRIPRYYGDKADFGDLDILLSEATITTNWEELRQEIITDLQVQDYILRPKLLSMAYRNFQVDVFCVPPEHFQSTWQFLCYNDLGNLLGKIFRRFNLKYGEKGLFYVFRRADGHYKRDLLLTQDMAQILAFLKLDWATWDAGFARLDAMFSWVVACPYFTVKPFLKRAASTEKRVQQRTTMQRFLDYLEANEITRAHPFAEDRDVYLPQIDAFFPKANLLEAIAREKEKECQDNLIREKFNGRIVMEMFGDLRGKILGRFMETFKQSFTRFNAEMVEMTPEEIKLRLEEHYNSDSWEK